jgi:hypothetical protein
MIAFGRPKGFRLFYKQWLEGGIAPQVVFEILSEGNTLREMRDKRSLYERLGVEEYYQYEPLENKFEAWIREGNTLMPVAKSDGFISQRLGIQFKLEPETMTVFYPGGSRFQTLTEFVASIEARKLTATELGRQADKESQRANEQRQHADEERKRADKLAAKLRQLGLDPDA